MKTIKQKEINKIAIKLDKLNDIKYSINFYNFGIKTIESLANKLIFYEHLPQHEIHNDVIYLPYDMLGKQPLFSSCLYTTKGSIIDSSRLYAGTETKSRTTAPEQIEVPQELNKDTRKFIYIGPLTKHYGHFLLESFNRLWFYLLEKDEDYYLLCHNNKALNQSHWMRLILELLGINIEKVVNFDKPTLVSEVIVPKPSFCLMGTVYRAHELAPQMIAKKIIKEIGEINKTSQPLYLSRRFLTDDKRTVENEVHLEEILIKKGVNIQYPQFLDFREQVYLINRHETIIGTMGSALHGVLFNLEYNKKIICLANKFLSPNYLLVDLLMSNVSYYINALTLVDPNDKDTPVWQKNVGINLETATLALQDIGII
jgi:capsular polysaccharide biosynthesis protein